MERFLDSFGVTEADLEKAAQEEIKALFEEYDDGTKDACMSIYEALEIEETALRLVEEKMLATARFMICSSIRDALERKGIITDPFAAHGHYYDIKWEERGDAIDHVILYLMAKTNYTAELASAVHLAEHYIKTQAD